MHPLEKYIRQQLGRADAPPPVDADDLWADIESQLGPGEQTPEADSLPWWKGTALGLLLLLAGGWWWMAGNGYVPGAELALNAPAARAEAPLANVPVAPASVAARDLRQGPDFPIDEPEVSASSKTSSSVSPGGRANLILSTRDSRRPLLPKSRRPPVTIPPPAHRKRTLPPQRRLPRLPRGICRRMFPPSSWR